MTYISSLKGQWLHEDVQNVKSHHLPPPDGALSPWNARGPSAPSVNRLLLTSALAAVRENIRGFTFNLTELNESELSWAKLSWIELSWADLNWTKLN